MGTDPTHEHYLTALQESREIPVGCLFRCLDIYTHKRCPFSQVPDIGEFTSMAPTSRAMDAGSPGESRPRE